MSKIIDSSVIEQTVKQVTAILNEAGITARTGRTRPDVGVIPDGASITQLIDHTQLDADTMARQVEMLCFEAKEFVFASVCVNSWYVPLASQMLKESDVTLCTVVGYPLGATLPQVTTYEAQEAIAAGAREIDMVIPVGALKSRDVVGVFEDISDVVTLCHDHEDEIICKVIIETSLLTEIETVMACQLAKIAGADFVVNSTDYQSDVDVDRIALMRQVVGEGMGVKAVGAIDSSEVAQDLCDAGANRIGTYSGVKIARDVMSD